MDSAHSLGKDFQPHCGGGNRFTQADKDYFIKFLCWSLKQDPSLSRGKLCELLAEKVGLKGESNPSK
jgi:hypothetical protein